MLPQSPLGPLPFRSRTPREARACSLTPPADLGAAGPCRPQDSTPLRGQRLLPVEVGEPPAPGAPAVHVAGGGASPARGGEGPPKAARRPFLWPRTPNSHSNQQANPGPRLRKPRPRRQQDADPVPLTAGAPAHAVGRAPWLWREDPQATGSVHRRGVAGLSSPLSTGLLPRPAPPQPQCPRPLGGRTPAHALALGARSADPAASPPLGPGQGSQWTRPAARTGHQRPRCRNQHGGASQTKASSGCRPGARPPGRRRAVPVPGSPAAPAAYSASALSVCLEGLAGLVPLWGRAGSERPREREAPTRPGQLVREQEGGRGLQLGHPNPDLRHPPCHSDGPQAALSPDLRAAPPQDSRCKTPSRGGLRNPRPHGPVRTLRQSYP